MKKEKQSSTIPDLKSKALEMALNDFDTFCSYAAVDKTQLSVCILRNKGLSLGQIGLKLEIPRSTVKDIVDRCFASEKSVR